MSTKMVGIDVGYGFVKAVTTDREVLFPSVVGAARPLRYRSEVALLDDEVDDIRINMDGRSFFVGSLAVRQSDNPVRSLYSNRAQDRAARVLFYSTLGLLAQWEDEVFDVVTGLPTMYYAGHREAFAAGLQGAQQLTLAGGEQQRTRRLRVERIRVIPQPLGSLYDRVLNSVGNLAEPEVARSTVGVVDIGFKTVDYAVATDLEYIDRLSGSIGIGLSNAYAYVAERLRTDYGVQRENHQLDPVMRQGSIRVAGRTEDVTALRREAYQRVGEKIASELESIWDPRDLDTVLITGGGAPSMAEYIMPRFANSVLVDGPQTANARGFLKLANAVFKPA